MYQRTLSAPLTIAGVGVHSGAPATLRLLPATANSGITFVRVDVTDKANRIPARWDCVVDTRMCTVLANTAGVSVATVEHLMAALRGCDVHNVTIEIDGPEIPIMDGSSAPFIQAIDEVGTVALAAPAYAIKVLMPICVEDGDKMVKLLPSTRATYEGEIDFTHDAIGRQSYKMELLNGNFRHELSEARTFGFFDDVEALRKMGLARGGSLDNAIVVDTNGVMNPEGLRFADEFIRHKLLDAVGDMYLAGAPVIAAYHANKPSHAMNNAVLRALFANKDAWAIVPMDGVLAPRELEVA
jgi:UDP-3-O-[3-hydroxymyristoyl] N-acetylglucosamine deacetylase